MSRLRQGVVDGAEGIADLGSKQGHDGNDNDSDESENDRVLDEALAFFFRCKQHGIISFPTNILSEATLSSKLRDAIW